MPLVATPGAPGQNAYVTVSEMHDYAETRVHHLAFPSDEVLAGAIIRASHEIDERFGLRFLGRRASGRAQPMQWPRSGAVDVEGFVVDDGDTPREVKLATMHLTLTALRAIQAGEAVAGGAIGGSDATAGLLVKRTKVGPLEEEFFEPSAEVSAAIAAAATSEHDPLTGLLGGLVKADQTAAVARPNLMVAR
jgi:hypothetical protein